MLQAAAKECSVNINAASMIKMTRQFRVNDRIVVKHEGVEVSGVLEVSIHFV